MHLTLLLFVAGLLILLAARALATPGATLAERVPTSWALAIGLAIGGISALIALSTQMDMIPDDIEAAALPFVIVAVTIGCIVGAWYRTFRR